MRNATAARPFLLERASELGLLDAALTDLAAGAGALLAFEGPHGSGRTHLLTAMAERAAVGGARVLRARAGPGDHGFPFGLIHQLVEPWLGRADPAERAAAFAGGARLAAGLFDYADGDLPDEPFPGGVHQPLYGLYCLFRNIAQRGALVLAIDDVQWADRLSLRFVQCLAERLDEVPVLILTTAVPHDHGTAANLLHDAYTGPWTRVVAVRPLSADGVGTITRAALAAPVGPAFAAACHELTAGNPYLLHEVLADLGRRTVEPADAATATVLDTVPRSVVVRVRTWLARLPEPAARLAKALAVLGGGHVRHAAEVAGLDQPQAVDAARVLAVAGLLCTGDGERARLQHPLIRAAIYEDLPAGFRTRAHDRFAHMLAAEGAPAEVIADHFLPAWPAGSRRVVDALRAAARCAPADCDPARRAAWLRRALQEPPPPEDRAVVLAELGAAERRARDTAAVAHLTAALTPALGAATPLSLPVSPPGPAPAAGTTGEPGPHADWPRGARRELTLALAAAGRGAEALDSHDVHRSPGHHDARPGPDAADTDLTAQLVAAVQLVPATRAHAARWLRRRPEGAAGTGLDACRAVDALAEGQAAAEVARHAESVAAGGPGRRRPALDGETLPACVAAWTLLLCDRHDAAEGRIRDVLRDADRSGLVLARAMAQSLHARLLLDHGRLEEAEALARAVARQTAGCELPGMAGALATATLLDALRERGRLDEADRLAGREAVRGPGGTPGSAAHTSMALVSLLHARGRLRLAGGRSAEAVDDLGEADLMVQAWSAATRGFGGHRPELAVALARLGRADEARAVAMDAVAAARQFGAPRLLAAALRAAGLTAGGAEGLTGLEEAAVLLESSPFPLDRAAALVAFGGALRRAGRRADARRHLQAAADLATAHGATALRGQALDELVVANGRGREGGPGRAGDQVAGQDDARSMARGRGLRRDERWSAGRDRGTAGDLTSLTPSERRVVRMAAEGMRNDQIARTLFVTVKAVEWHLSNAYPKLGVRSRNELPAVLSAGGGLLDGVRPA